MFGFKKKKYDTGEVVDKNVSVRKLPLLGEKILIINSREYFNGVVSVDFKSNCFETRFTEKGQETLNKLTYNELLSYYSEILNSLEINVEYNICGIGPACRAADFAAFHLLSRAILDRINCLNLKIGCQDLNDIYKE
jgi:hypothetical protein